MQSIPSLLDESNHTPGDPSLDLDSPDHKVDTALHLSAFDKMEKNERAFPKKSRSSTPLPSKVRTLKDYIGQKCVNIAVL